MPRPEMDVNGPEYQALLQGRAMVRRFGMNYKDAMWAEEVLERLESKLPYGDYTDQDHADFFKAKEIYARLYFKADGNDGETAERHTTARYIWRTRGDGKVRPEHAANNGKIFSWDNPPSTGHPGEAYGCRCWAEAYHPEELQERISHTVNDAAEDASPAWEKKDFIRHYFTARGTPVTLHEIGHLQNIITASEITVFKNVTDQICVLARSCLQSN